MDDAPECGSLRRVESRLETSLERRRSVSDAALRSIRGQIPLDRSLVKDRARPLVAVILLLMSCRHARRETVLFMCPHGGAKSLIAASYFNRMAAEKNLPFTAVAVAADDPYESVPAPIADLLEGTGSEFGCLNPGLFP